MQKIRKILQAVPEKAALPTNQPTNQISKSLILGQFGDLFVNVSKSRIFFKNPALSIFYIYSPLTSCKKSEKSLQPFLRKLRYKPSKQPVITNNTNLIRPRWRRSKKHTFQISSCF